ncbi:TSUP family transporter [Sneathiella sp. P13V-1]|uniref:sulfite exporter TauE/SafE family protein n=1 Tax=Sneathiella sp. P13V-1 TaxID=2697366 RepID=UPI00187B569C|nr:sulfite exporter TauE/SafE family protein [Sneathiella sp. P13V-1]MBE7637294.1 TSUP family transporter [Sneathiella sp. P13V-1]
MFDFAGQDIELLLVLGAALIGTGIVAGILAGLLGVGGGIVIVPVLYHLLSYVGVAEEVRMHVAVGTSLATIILTSISSARAHHKKGAIDVKLLKSWGIIIFLGVLGGTWMASIVNAKILTGVFAVLALLVAANMAFRPDGAHLADKLPSSPLKEVLALFIGWFSAMMGIGGGTFSVPILTLFNYPIRQAVGTAAAIGLIIAIPGTIGFLAAGMNVTDLPPGNLGYVNILGFLIIVPMTMLFAPVGAHIAHTINTGMLKKAFAFFLFLTSLRMFYGIFG